MIIPLPRVLTTALIVVTTCLATASALMSARQKASEVPGVLLTRQLMEARGLRVGDTVRLSTEPSGVRARTFRVDGLYEPAPDPMRFAQPRFEARLHLPDLASLLADPADPASSDTVTSINVALKEPGQAASFARDLAARLPGAVARPTSAPDDRTSTFVVLERFHLAIAIVTVVGSAVFLLALMVMLVEERRGTVGILRLIGFTRWRILLQVFAEGALIAVAGAVFGVLFALASQSFFNRFFQWRYDTTLIFLRITPGVALQSVAMAVPLGIIASLIASWTLLRRELLTLIRR
jgi:ABC-type lipoprotein release transport system permease subunit